MKEGVSWSFSLLLALEDLLGPRLDLFSPWVRMEYYQGKSCSQASGSAERVINLHFFLVSCSGGGLERGSHPTFGSSLHTFLLSN